MLRKYFPLYLLIVFGVFTFCIVKFQKPQPKLTLSLKERNIDISPVGEWLNTKAAINGLIEQIRTNPDNIKVKLNLALAYIQEGRVTGEHAYYDAAALQLLEEVLIKEKNNFDALCAKATLQLSQHHFSEALITAQQAVKLNEYNSNVYGIMTDAYVELGDYQKAIEMADKMASTRPDLRSYSRIAYLREIVGDYPGAIEAMQMAVNAGFPGLEQTSWVRCQLGNLYELTGDLDNALLQYNTTLHQRFNFPYAWAGLARIDKINSNYKGAIEKFKTARRLMNDYSFDAALADCYWLIGDADKANKHAQQAITDLAGLQGDESEANHGHYADRELAMAYLHVFDYNKALHHALIEYNRRPDNIDVNRTLAWVYYKRREFDKANNFIDRAMITKSKNPELLFEAGLIKIKNGNTAAGEKLIAESQNINPFTSSELKLNYKQVLASLSKKISQNITVAAK